MTEDPHKALRDDVRQLGRLFGRTLRHLEGDLLFALVEEVRALAKRAHASDPSAFEQLADRLSDLPIAAAVPIARAFAQFLVLANIAEQHHRVRRRRVRAHTGAPPAPGFVCRRILALARQRLAGRRARRRREIATDRARAHGASDGDGSAHPAANISPDCRPPHNPRPDRFDAGRVRRRDGRLAAGDCHRVADRECEIRPGFATISRSEVWSRT